MLKSDSIIRFKSTKFTIRWFHNDLEYLSWQIFDTKPSYHTGEILTPRIIDRSG